jgi:hypothetical protein
MIEFSQAADALTVHLSPYGRGRIASIDAIRVRGHALSWDLRPLTRAFGATSPRWGEVGDRHRGRA